MIRKKKISIVFVLIFACLTNVVYGQKKSDLYLKVDSIMVNQLAFDKEAKKKEIQELFESNLSDSSSAIIRCVATIQVREEPLIVLNQISVKQEELNKYQLSDVKRLQVFKGSEATALYGTQAAYGVIVISTRKKKEKL